MKTVGIYIFDEAEVMDFSAPFEAFSVANRLKKRLGEPEPYEVLLIAEKDHPIRGRNNFQVLPHHTIENHPALDVLIVAGGVVTEELKKSAVIEWIRQVHEGTETTASICTGAFLLAEAGLLEGKTATTHWEDLGDLQKAYPQVNIQEGIPFTQEGKVFTSAGVSAGMILSLHLIGLEHGMDFAVRVAKQIEFPFEVQSAEPLKVTL
ncbi:DJ-1/PfpI family protein [Deinococcus cellulosilyticus]|uniref:Glutamine amidotransferase n=1 Tax=Deinococcus cellulosilyticus (strain DSM 18568 / NBRC 106333 / KACC 11606 / 5516J-15) TaxID=1223518 RepID=A0A511N4N4_DEIC1|nr:DJ-1/PfpI family protein [Deinococcus cellulosilyticus]GEM47819.1 glutamine amidotransferase [Deinococcus cellulosilyticus NBRC 106333 = KACC 11606]